METVGALLILLGDTQARAGISRCVGLGFRVWVSRTFRLLEDVPGRN